MFANLKHKITLINLFTISMVLVFCFIVFGITIHVQNKTAVDRRLIENYNDINDRLTRYLRTLDYTAYTVMYSNWVQKFMVVDKTTPITEFVYFQRNASHFLANLAWINENISFVLISKNVLIWSNYALHYDPHYDIQKQPWFDELIANKKYVEYGGSELFRDLKDTWSITLYYPVTSYYNFALLGYLAINVTIDNLALFTQQTGKKSTTEWVQLWDENGRIIYPIVGGRGDEISFSGPLLEGHLFIELYERRSLNLFEQFDLWYFFFLLLIPIITIFVIINSKFSHYLTVSILKCKEAMLAIHNNNFGVKLNNHYHDEIGQLIDGYNEMSGSLVELLRKNRENERRRRDTELNILQQRVNPHFLYNTLEIINGFILDGQNTEAAHVCELLGQMYHYNLANRKWVTLREECEYVKQYLEIFHQSNSKLSVVWDLCEESMNTDILKMILQPLAENAVLHGLRDRSRDPCLTISAKNNDMKTNISIMDNGRGIIPERLVQIKESLEKVRNGCSLDTSHIGIPNVYQRLYLEYGESMFFSIESKQGYGTRLFLSIPKTAPL